MTHPNLKKRERIAPLGEGLEIWHVHHDCLREQDKNARVMPTRKFDRLSDNIGKRGALEQLPYVYNPSPDDPETEFQIISGHHRIRAARKAQIEMLCVLVETREMSRDEITAKQLAHNALVGFDDPQVLAEMFFSIEDIEARIETGIADEDLELGTPVDIGEMSFDLDHEIVNIVFVKRDYDRFEEVLELLEADSHVVVADYEDFDGFKRIAIDVSQRFDVRNIAAIVAKMVRILNVHYLSRAKKIGHGEDEWVEIEAIVGSPRMPVGPAGILQRAVTHMVENGDVRDRNAWQALEYLAAEYLARVGEKAEE